MRVCLIVLFFPLFTYGTSTCDPETVAGSSILLEACEVNNQLCSALVNNHRGRHVSMLHTRFASGEPRTDGRDIIRSNQMTYYNTQNSGPNYHTFLTTVRTINGIQGPAVNFDGTNYMSEFDIYRDINLNMVVRNSSDVQNIRALEEQQDYLPLQMALLRQAGVSTGYQVSIGAVDYVVSEVQGQILDQTGDYIFLRSSAGVQKVSMAEFYVQIMDRLPSGFMANARSLVRSGGRLTRSLSAGPLGAILEMTITPTMAACATVDTLFIRNVCSRDPVEFHRWFRELDRWDRTQVLSDSGYCQAIYNRIERKVAELESRENSSRTRFNQIWNPENVSCDPSRQSMEFTLQNNLLPAPSNSSAPSSQQYYRYIIEKHCPPDVELSACSNRISVETWSRNISRPIRPTQQIVLRHGQRMSLTSWSGGDRRLTPGIQRIENTTIAEDDPKLQRLIQESVDLCSRLYSPELYEFDDGETSTTTTD